MSEAFQYRKSRTDDWKDFPPPFEVRVKPDPFAPFKEALARGDRVDARAKGLPPGVGWEEVPPNNSVWLRETEFRIALPWQDERDAFDRGETIEYKSVHSCRWEVVRTPSWFEGLGEYRVKPKSKVETFEAGMLMQHSPLPFDGISLKPAPFRLPRIAFDIEHADGEVINVTLKEWTK